MKWEEWLLDVSLDPPVFVPYERASDSIVFGMNTMTDKCPGKLVGVIHQDGQDAVETWCSEHPNWVSLYGRSKDNEESN